MLLDRENTVDTNRALTAAGNFVSTDAIDLWGSTSVPTIPQGGSVIKDVGRGMLPRLLVQVTTTFLSGTSIQAQVVGATANDLTTGQIIYNEGVAIPVASLVAGYQFRVEIPPGITLRFLGVRYVVVGVFTAGTVTSTIAMDLQTNQFVG